MRIFVPSKHNIVMTQSVYKESHYAYEVRTPNGNKWSVDKRKMQELFNSIEGKAEFWKLKNGVHTFSLTPSINLTL